MSCKTLGWRTVLSQSCGVTPAHDMILSGLVAASSSVVAVEGSHFEREIVLCDVRRYVAYPISYRQLEETMRERAVQVETPV
jgi:hypothetical protein